MASFSLMHWLVVAVVILVLFGRGKISQTMGDFGQGIRSFRQGLADGDSPAVEKMVPITHTAPAGAENGAGLPSETATRPTDA